MKITGTFHEYGELWCPLTFLKALKAQIACFSVVKAIMILVILAFCAQTC